MKRCLAIILVLLLWLNLVACNPSVTPTTTQPTIITTTSTVANTTGTTTTTKPTTTTTSASTTVQTTATTVVTPTTTKSTTTTTTTTVATTTTTTVATTTQTTAPTTTTAPPSSGPRPLLYEVSHNNGTVVWLFGSIHIGRDNMYPLPEYVLNALYQADSVAVEFDPTVLTESNYVDALQNVRYQDGSTIGDHLPPDVYQNARAVLEEHGMYGPHMEHYKPSFWANSISTVLMNQLPYTADKGVDRHIISLAKQKNIPVKNIESLHSQYAMFGNYSPLLQTTLLESALTTYKQGPDLYLAEMNNLMDAWFFGRKSELGRLLQEDDPELTDDQKNDELLQEYKNAMYTTRNRAMYDYILQCFENKESTFVCVGAAHIVGTDSALYDALRAANDKQWTVTSLGQ